MRITTSSLLWIPALALALAGPASANEKGDVNGDGVWDVVDVMMVHKSLVGQITLDAAPGGEAFAADVAPMSSPSAVGDGVVEAADLATLTAGIFDGDLDEDGISTAFEHTVGTNPFLGMSDGQTLDGELDPDADALDHAGEEAAGTDPFDADTDDDGLLDGDEVAFGFDPLVDGGEAQSDPDGDGLTVIDEIYYGTDPFRADTDWDGLLDGDDLDCPFDPGNDEDGDGLCYEADNCAVAANPTQEDGDGDGIGDACDLCPGAPGTDHDFDGVCGAADNCPDWSNPGQGDEDGDGRGDACECGDVDDDGLVDGDDLVMLQDWFANQDFLVPGPHKCDLDGDTVCTPDDVALLDGHLNQGTPAELSQACADVDTVVGKGLSRLGYGADDWSRARVGLLNPVGYIEEQLEPEAIPDPDFNERVDPYVNGPYPTLGRPVADLRNDYCGGQCLDNYRRVVANLAEARLLRTVYSRRQIQAMLADFFVNHFNVNGATQQPRYSMQDYEQLVILPRVLGRFEDLVQAVTESAAMLDYLDLRRNKKNNTNENYARELMELHTLGVDGGYDEADVQEVTRILTGYGWTGNPDYEFDYDENQHDDGDKLVTIDGTPPWSFDDQTVLECDGIPETEFDNDGEVLICLLSRHPATAERLARKLIERFAMEDPPQAFVDAVKQVWLDTDGDLHAVMHEVLLNGWWDQALFFDTKVKRPLRYAATLVRAVGKGSEGASQIQDQGWSNTRERNSFNGIMGALEDMGEDLFKAAPPTGYPEPSAAWSDAGGILLRINLADDLVDALADPEALFGIAPGSTNQAIVDALAAQLANGMTEADRAQIVGFLDVALAGEPQETRVRQAASLILSSPKFLQY